MRPLTVTGLSADGRLVELRDGDETFVVPLADVRRAQRPAPVAPPPPPGTPPSPREVQQRIRCGESAAGIAASSGLPVETIARYEGPVLAERQHQARTAGRAEVDGRVVGELVEEHLARTAPGLEPEWDAWLVGDGRWEVWVTAGEAVLRLGWQPATRRVSPLDETTREALLLSPAAQDTLGAVLRPVAARRTAERAAGRDAGADPATVLRFDRSAPVEAPVDDPAPAPNATPDAPAATGEPAPAAEGPVEAPTAPAPRPSRPARKGRASVPAWSDISADLTARPAVAVPGQLALPDEGDSPS